MVCEHLLADPDLMLCEFGCEDESALPSVPIANPAAWMSTYHDLHSRALMRAGQRINYTLFMKVPGEVRKLIYSFVLASPRAIQPHLCASDPHSKPTFHDANNTDHASLFQLTALTRASKEFRKEALPMFYAANVFAAGDDTVTYLEYLKSMGRLEWVQNVEVVIEAGCVERAAWVLRCVEQVDVEGAQHEQEGRRALLLAKREEPGEPRVWRGGASASTSMTGRMTTNPAASTHHMTTRSTSALSAPSTPDSLPVPIVPGLSSSPTTQDLTLHPHYHVSGFQPLALALLLRVLSTPSSSPNAASTSSSSITTSHPLARHIVLPLPAPQIFTSDPTLRWFPTLVRGLGMSLRLVQHTGTARMEGDGRFVVVMWERRFQGAETAYVTAAVEGGEGGDEVANESQDEMMEGEIHREGEAYAGDVHRRGNGAVAGPCASTGADLLPHSHGVLDRARDLIPNLDLLRRSEKTCFSRRDCRGEELVWFDLQTFGGARLASDVA